MSNYTKPINIYEVHTTQLCHIHLLLYLPYWQWGVGLCWVIPQSRDLFVEIPLGLTKTQPQLILILSSLTTGGGGGKTELIITHSSGFKPT